MLTFLIAFLVSLGLSTALVPVVKAMARRLGLVDHGRSSRKIHAAPIPRLGGIAIAAAFYAPLVGLFFHANEISQRFYAHKAQALALVLGGLVIFGLGLVDDLRGLGAKAKFAVQFAVALACWHWGLRIEEVALPFAGTLRLGPLAPAVTLLWIVGLVNAFNLIDGLDGLAGGVAFFGIVTTFAMSLFRSDLLMSLYMASLGGAVLGFLIFNFNPASIFMGDCGSMFLGYALAVTSLQTSQKSSTTVALLVPVIALGLPIMDTMLAMIRRFLRGRSMFSADREHIHHRLLALGYTQRRAVLMLYGLCLFLGAVALALTFSSGMQSALLLVAVGAVCAVLIRKLGYLNGIRPPPGATLTEIRERNLSLRAAVREAGERIRQAEGREELWETLEELAPLLGAQELRLELRSHAAPGSRRVALFTWQLDESPLAAPVEVRLPLGSEQAGSLAVSWRNGAGEVDRDQEIALELLAEHLTSAVDRLARRATADPGVVRPLRTGR